MINIISHCYQEIDIQNISYLSTGTTELYKFALNSGFKKIIFCGVLYMAEDLYALSNGQLEIFLPEIKVKDNMIVQPRCPMELDASIDHILEASKHKPDSILTYVNTSASLKAASNGVYNGTEALRIIREMCHRQGSKGKIVLIGDRNVNWWIRELTKSDFANIQIISLTPDIYCPPHDKINEKNITKILDSLRKEKGKNNVGALFHSEINTGLLSKGINENIYIGGTTGMQREISMSEKNVWIVPTIQDFVKKMRSMFPEKRILSPKIICSPMKYNTHKKVLDAVSLLNSGSGPVADIVFTRVKEPYYDIIIHRNKYVQFIGEAMKIPAVRLSIDADILAKTRKNLLTIVK